MQLPSVDRQAVLAPTGADLALPGAGRVVPVAPVNPVQPSIAPSVVNQISDAAGGAATEVLTYSKVSDPVTMAPESASSPRDWTIQHAAPEKVELPPPVPMSKQLLDFLQAVWRASASAVEIAQSQNQPLQTNPVDSPGRLAKEAITYSSSKIRKNEKL